MIELTAEMRRLVAARMGLPDGAELDPWMVAALEDVLALVERDYLSVMRDLVDADPCWFDHHGGCQAHGFLSLEPGEKCPHARAKELLGGTS
ncbi:MAG TPA: hypothetical protein VOB72_08260 [Candidatus Dormibacteraeota bacterium]|nr:hypothetical protein [Candidatus Dormibacteraeota bacterium]